MSDQVAVAEGVTVELGVDVKVSVFVGVFVPVTVDVSSVTLYVSVTT